MWRDSTGVRLVTAWRDGSVNRTGTAGTEKMMNSQSLFVFDGSDCHCHPPYGSFWRSRLQGWFDPPQCASRSASGLMNRAVQSIGPMYE